MAHITEVVAYKKLSSGQFSACIRCCDAPSTDWWHTMAADVAADPEKRKASIGGAKQMCAEQHEAATKAEDALLGEMGSKTEHP